MVSRYFSDNYCQKSREFLYPLTELAAHSELLPLNCYLNWEGVDEYDIINNKLIITFDKEVVLPLSQYIVAVRYTEDVLVCIYDVTEFKEIIDIFLSGKYSELPAWVKDKILIHNNWYYTHNNVKLPVSYINCDSFKDYPPIWHCFLYPKEMANKLAFDLVHSFNFFSDEEYAKKQILSGWEPCPLFDIVKETLTSKITI